MQNSPPPDRVGPIVFAISSALFIVLFVSLCFAVSIGIEQNKVRLEKENKLIISESPLARTILHDNHWYIDWAYSNMFTHHPDCPCGKSDGNVILEKKNDNEYKSSVE